MTYLIYGLCLCALAQIEKNKRAVASIVAASVILCDVVYQFGLVTGQGYYLFCAAMCVSCAAALCYVNAVKLVGHLHNACIAAFVLNAVDWVLYTNTDIITDILYEYLFIALYLYMYWALLGKGGVNVCGRIRDIKNRRYNPRPNGRIYTHNMDRN